MSTINMLSWWQWSLLAAIPPAIVLLYFLKLRRVPLQVPSTFLWHKSIEDLHVNSIWQRLRQSILLLLQILLIAATLFLVGFDLKAPILITTLVWTVAVSTLVSGAAYVWVAAHGR